MRTIILLTTELITEWLVAGSGHLTRGENLSDPVRIEAEGGGPSSSLWSFVSCDTLIQSTQTPRRGTAQAQPSFLIR